MIQYTIFNKTTGYITCSGVCADDAIDGLMVSSEDSVIRISSDPVTQMIDVSTNTLTSRIRPVNEVANEVRFMRNQLLAETDWTQLSDVDLSIKQKYIVYRQELRDISGQPGFPLDITWPTKPE